MACSMAARKKFRRLGTAGFQGEFGAFSQSAVIKLLGSDVKARPFATFAEVFAALRNSSVQFGVIPIENSLHGSILENYDHLLKCGFPIVGETSMRISHQLIAMPSVSFRSVRRVFSHPVALNQCRNFFAENPQLEPIPFYDTAGSVKMLLKEKPKDGAAIASAEAAEIYSGKILKKSIEDDRRNFTRFFLLTKQKSTLVPVSAHAKVSLTFTTSNSPGSLFRAMACLALRNLNLIKIESRPLIGKPWEYRFYVDFLGSLQNPAVKSAISNLIEMTQSCQVLGNYESLP